MNKKLLSAALVGALALAPNVMASAEEVATSTNEEIVISTADSETLTAPTQSAAMKFVTNNIIVENEDDSNNGAQYELYDISKGSNGLSNPIPVYANDKSTSAYFEDITTEQEYLDAVDSGNNTPIGSYVGFSGYQVSVSTDFEIISNGQVVEMPSAFLMYIPNNNNFETGYEYYGGSIYMQATPTSPIYEVDGSSCTRIEGIAEEGYDYVLPVIIDGVEGTFTFTKMSGGSGVSEIPEDSIEFTPTYGVDNGLPDAPADNPNLDTDHDGLTDEEEVALGTEQDNWDTDGDGVGDGFELTIGTDPKNADSDFDGLSDGYEYQKNMNPTNPDSDSDGIYDGSDQNPTTDDSVDPADPGYGISDEGGDLDPDHDGLTNWEEDELGTDPNNWDTDGDGVADGFELTIKTDPSNADTDNDGLTDGYEYQKNMDPTVADGDHDGLTDGEEIDLGTNYTKWDTDGDGVADGFELTIGTDPLNADTDNDGLTDGYEYQKNMNPNHPDTDGDGIYDFRDENPTIFDEVEPAYPLYGLLVERLNNALPPVEAPVDPEYGIDADHSVNNDLPEVETPEGETPEGETPDGEDTDKDPVDSENKEDDTLAYTGANPRVGLLAALGSALFIFKRRG